MKLMLRQKEIKRTERGQMNLKDRVIEILEVQTRDQQVITLGQQMALSVEGVAKLMLMRIAIGSLVPTLDVAR